MLTDYSFAFQPIINIVDRQFYAYEALIRGKNQESAASVLANIPPNDQIEFDYQISKIAINLAIKLGLTVNLNINFTPYSLLDETKIANFVDFVNQSQLKNEQIIIELTESAIIHDYNKLMTSIKFFRQAGMQVAIDDFGAGYSGLNLLVNYQPQIIKLDINLIKNIHKVGSKQVIVKAVLWVCKSLGIEVIAEGVEIVEELEWLKFHGVELYQGYLFAEPIFEQLRVSHFLHT